MFFYPVKHSHRLFSNISHKWISIALRQKHLMIALWQLHSLLIALPFCVLWILGSLRTVTPVLYTDSWSWKCLPVQGSKPYICIYYILGSLVREPRYETASLTMYIMRIWYKHINIYKFKSLESNHRDGPTVESSP